jgi:hypothetical protein
MHMEARGSVRIISLSQTSSELEDLHPRDLSPRNHLSLRLPYTLHVILLEDIKFQSWFLTALALDTINAFSSHNMQSHSGNHL